MQIQIFLENAEKEELKRPYAQGDAEITVYDLAMYEAGRLHVYLVCHKAGFYPLEQIAETMQIDIDKLRAIKHIWNGGEIVERRDAIVEILMEEIQKKTQKEEHTRVCETKLSSAGRKDNPFARLCGSENIHSQNAEKQKD